MVHSSIARIASSATLSSLEALTRHLAALATTPNSSRKKGEGLQALSLTRARKVEGSRLVQ